jgi:hypothetical protein
MGRGEGRKSRARKIFERGGAVTLAPAGGGNFRQRAPTRHVRSVVTDQRYDLALAEIIGEAGHGRSAPPARSPPDVSAR